MISFHKAEAADRVWAHEILKNCEYPGAEYAFSCMYLWSDYFGELGRVGDHLTQHASWRGREVYLYPAGAGDIKGAIEAIRADAAERGGPLRLRSLTKDKKEELEALVARWRERGAIIELLPCAPADISSTAIRARAAAGLPLAGLVPPQVETYIRANGLYQEGL